MIEEIRARKTVRRFHQRSLGEICIAGTSIAGGLIVILGAWLSWFSLFAGLQPYRGVDVLNGRLLAGGGVVSILAGVRFLRHGGIRLRWGIGLLGFALLAFASWSLFQLLILYRQLSADQMMVARLGSGLIFIIVGSLLIFATFFLNDESPTPDRPS
ncbi:MAG TPA: hypothetical protein VFU37_10745 [Pyrinomonadaceae bacterium]|nr:hypothetical protein [Pyrinomonadaceae bacterium]